MSSSIPLDKLYLENLEEFIFDDEKFVSFKWLSCKLGVHVNLAKQMLYQFLQVQKEKGLHPSKIHAMYYLSGRAPQKWIASINPNAYDPPPPPSTSTSSSNNLNSEGEDDDHQENPGSPELLSSQDMDIDDEASESDKGDAFLVMICTDKELEETRKNFTELFSIHVYGLSKYPMTREKLDEFTAVPIFDDEGRSPIHYGPMTCAAAREYRPEPYIAIRLQNIAQVKVKVAEDKAKWEKEQADKLLAAAANKKKNGESSKTTTKDFFAASTSSSDKKTAVASSSTTSNKGGAGAAVGKQNRLKNMFAAVAAKPKPLPPKFPAEAEKKAEEPQSKKMTFVESSSDEEEVEEKKAVNKKASTSSKSWSSKRKEAAAAAAAKKKKEGERNKRKRIKDVFSSSSEEEEESDKNKSSEEEDEETLPESPIPKKYLSKSKIQSDSEDDDFQEDPRKRNGRKRSLKTVPKRHVDDEGFLVTVMEQVMVSESDNSEGEELKGAVGGRSKEQNVDKKDETDKRKPTAAEISKSSSSTSEASSSKGKQTPLKKEPTAKQSSTSKGGAGGGGDGKKQASIMSFFQKK